MDLDGWTRDLLIFLVTAGIIVPVFYRARIGTVLAFLIAGAVLGPGGLGSLVDQQPWLRHITFVDEERVEPFAQLGVMFLLFTIGLELSFQRLWAMRRYVFGAGTAQTLGATVAIGGVAMAFGVALDAAIVFGLGLAFSSTAIVLQLLIQARRLSADVGKATLGILLMQDLMVVPGVILISVLAGEGETSIPLALLRGIGTAIAAVLVIVVLGRYLLHPLLRLAASTGSREIVVAIGILVAVAGAAITSAVGLSPALGALLGGLLLGASEYRHQIEVDIEPFKGLLLGLFFMSVGMSLNFAFLASEILPILAAVVALIVVKLAVVFAVCRVFGLRTPESLEAGFLLAGAGEFAFVLFTLARQEGLMTSADLRFVTTVAAISMMLTPILGPLGTRLSRRMRARVEEHGEQAPTGTLDTADHVVIGGFGRVGAMVARTLDAASVPYVALDLDPDNVSAARAEGRHVYFGDASRFEILEKLGGSKAKAFVLTSDMPAQVDLAVKAIRDAWPDVAIYARARDPDHGRRLAGLGATAAVPEAFEGSLSLARRVLVGVGVPDELAEEATRAILAEAMKGATVPQRRIA
ncbi:MAG: cation:proton antiporter [Bauldia sp.]